MAGEVQTVTVTVTGADGKPSEITVPKAAVVAALGTEYLPATTIERELERRTAGIVKNQGLRKPEELLDDQAFVAQVLEKHGKKAADSAAADQLKETLARQRREWEERELAPAKTRLEAKEKREHELLTRDLERQIVQAAAGLLHDAMLRSTTRGAPPPIVAMLEDAFAYDEESGEFYVADGDNFAFSTNPDRPKDASPYKTIAEFIGEWAAKTENAHFRRPGQGGAGHQGGGSGGGAGGAATGAIMLSREEAQDAATYQKALARVGGDHSKIKVKDAQQWV